VERLRLSRWASQGEDRGVVDLVPIRAVDATALADLDQPAVLQSTARALDRWDAPERELALELGVGGAPPSVLGAASAPVELLQDDRLVQADRDREARQDE
jgi:hypothetical protein